MQLTDVFCYVLFMISVTATCVRSNSHTRESSDKQLEKKIVKREAAIVFMGNFPVESITSENPKMLYRRVSKQRYPTSKAKYNQPRTKFRPTTRKPYKKYKIKKLKPKFTNNKKRSPEPRYVQPHTPALRNKPKRGKRPWGTLRLEPRLRPVQLATPPVPQQPFKYLQLETSPTGFGEPPEELQGQKPTYGEPSIDSYGAPLRSYAKEPQTVPEDYPNYEAQDTNTATDYQILPQQSYFDSNFGYSNKYQAIEKPSVFQSERFSNEENLNTYSDVFRYKETKKKPYFLVDHRKTVNKWISAKNIPATDDTIVVGGQYAEPPARYVPKFQPSAPVFMEDTDFFNLMYGYIDSELVTVSPYVNYKNSNMAFSPQNLNDAFSIVDKR